MTPWRNLGVVETIYEEESDYSSTTNSPSLSENLSSPPLHSRIQLWSQKMEREPDVVIYVRGTSFHLHKDPMSTKSKYLKRHLTDLSEFILPAPLKITPDVFSLISDYCYGSHIAITPFNVSPLRVAAELLQMTDHVDGEENLVQMTETYFCRFVAVNQEYALLVFRSCLSLLPEAETMGSLLGRSVEALSLTEYGDCIDTFVKDVMSLRVEDFNIVAESMQCRFSCHDLLYRMVDIYFKEHNSGKMAEEQKIQLCSFIDCTKLSNDFLIHAVQNPRMPLRFLVKAMLAEQLNTKLSLVTTATNNHHHKHRPQPPHGGPTGKDSLTLGVILQRDSALRQAAQLKSEMNATTSRIHNLERELFTMKKLLQESEKKRVMIRSPEVGSTKSVMDSGRSASFHCLASQCNKIERGEKGSSSSLSGLRFGNKGKERWVILSTSSDDSSTWHNEMDDYPSPNPSPMAKKNIGQKLINGLKSAFRVSKHYSKDNVNTSL